MTNASYRDGATSGHSTIRWLALAFATITVALIGFGITLATRFELGELEPVGVGFYVGMLPFGLAGGYLAWRKPENAIGWWLLAVAFFWTTASAGVVYGIAGLTSETGRLPADELSYLLTGPLWAPGLLAIGMVVFLFPTGRPPSPGWKWLQTAAVGVTVVIYLSALLLPDLLEELGRDNPIAWHTGSDTISLIFVAATVALFALGVIAALSLLVRYRRSVGIERQQLKWFFFPIMTAASIAALLSIRDLLGFTGLSQLFEILQGIGVVAIGLMPVAIAIAVVRFGLYELGRIVNRTIVYSLLAVFLTLVYSGSVLLLTTVIPGDDNPVAIAAATLAVAALFNPIRRRVQKFVDRRLHRKSYDAVLVQQHLHERLQNTIHPDEVSEALLESVNSALLPSGSAVWIRSD